MVGGIAAKTGVVVGLAEQYDVAGRRTRLTWNDGFYVTYDYDNLGAMTAVRENGGTALASYGYDGFGRRTSIAYGNGTQTTYAYDGASRLSGLSHDLAGGSYDQSYGFAYNPAGQITSRTASNDAYAFTGNASADRSYATNGLNQYTQSGGVSLGYDTRGNLTQSGSDSYSYTTENHLASSAASGQRAATSLYHDPLDRLYAITSSQTIFDYDGADLVLETDQSTGTQVRARYVYGADETPVVWYPQASTDGKRYLYADERGSVVALVDASGNALQFDSYSPYGIPAGSNTGRFQYTGQKWIAELGMYDYKARIYSPTLGRFLQTDPIGYGDGMNAYAYVGNDPVNWTDPSGLSKSNIPPKIQSTFGTSPDIVVTGPRGGGNFFPNDPYHGDSSSNYTNTGSSGGLADLGGAGQGGDDGDVEVTASVNCGIHPEDPRCAGMNQKNNYFLETPSHQGGAPCLPGLDCKPIIPNCTIANNYCGAKPKPAPPKPAKKPSYIEQCLNNAAENYANGVSFSGLDLAGCESSRAGNALIRDPMTTGGLNGAGAAKAAAGIPFYEMGYYIGRSCP